MPAGGVMSPCATPKRQKLCGVSTRGISAIYREGVGKRSSSTDYLRWRIFERMRRFLRPSLRRPLPVFLVPTQGSVERARRNDSRSEGTISERLPPRPAADDRL